mmetsp:Transcript_6383/g.9288  ORF Transcript_6383/g.9288 Transcript_6383/m.9288 type:complete len:445 (-) Transcript_6383:62-1396(-)
MPISATEQWNAFVNTIFSSFSKPSVGITTAGSLLLILLVSVWYLNKNKKNSRKDENGKKKLREGGKITGTTAAASASNEGKGTSNDEKKTKTDAPSLPSSILDIHRNTGKVGGSGSKRNNNSAKKAQPPPSSSSDKRGFGSSYYYAHNSSGTGGGYKDGLKMEDYTMNQPRLLSKGGVVVDNATTSKNADNVFDKVYTTAAQSSVVMQDNRNEDAEQQQQQQQPAKQEASSSRESSSTPPSAKEEEAQPIRRNSSSQQILQNSTLITRYGWEDTPELSKIRIDSLPHSQSTLTNPKTPISWKDANIPKTGVVAKLINQNKGLFVTFQSSNDHGDDGGERYHLHLPSLYDEASDVKTLWKPNKFIVKIVKRSGKHQKTWGALTGTTQGSGNSGGVGGIGKDGFDEDLLNQVAFGGSSSGRPSTDVENDDAANKSGGKGIFSSFLS